MSSNRLERLYIEKISKEGWKELTSDEHNLVDGSENFSKADGDGEATIRFTPPNDWQPLISFTLEPRYYITIRTKTTPATEASALYLLPAGGANYGLGWQVSQSEEDQHTLAYTNSFQQFMKGTKILGEESLAYAVVDVDGPAQVSSGQLVIRDLQGGSFLPGESILVDGASVATIIEREFALNPSTSHGGLLWGTTTYFKHRKDNINWVVLFNYDNGEVFSQPGVSASSVGIDSGIDAIITSGQWPTWDLFTD